MKFTLMMPACLDSFALSDRSYRFVYTDHVTSCSTTYVPLQKSEVRNQQRRKAPDSKSQRRTALKQVSNGVRIKVFVQERRALSPAAYGTGQLCERDHGRLNIDMLLVVD